MSLTKAIHKLDSYLDIMEESPVYWAAALLHPGYRKRLVHKTLEIERAAQVLFGAEEFIKSEMARLGASQRPPTATTNTGTDLKPFHEHLLGPDFYEELESGPSDELAIYPEDPPVPCDVPIQWWLAQKNRFPMLHRVAVEHPGNERRVRAGLQHFKTDHHQSDAPIVG